jgi:membrane protease subunit HflC
MRYKLVAATLAIIMMIVARSAFFIVDRTEYVYLTQFGKPVHTYDGARNTDAGLHVKWPWPVQSVQLLDRRLQYFDLTGAELLTRDAKGNTIDKTLTIDAYVCWRIDDSPGGVDRFIRSVGTPEGARAILEQRISSELGAAVGQMELEDLVSIQPGKVDQKRETLRKRLLHSQGASLQDTAKVDYGIDVVDIRVRRTNHPVAVQQAIFSRIISERNKKVADYRSEGERQAADIKSTSERRVAELKSTADAEAIRLRGQADAEADRIRNEAAAQDPQFYAFLRKLEDYQRILGDNKTMLLLSTHRELFDTLFQPPAPAKPEAR